MLCGFVLQHHLHVATPLVRGLLGGHRVSSSALAASRKQNAQALKAGNLIHQRQGTSFRLQVAARH